MPVQHSLENIGFHMPSPDITHRMIVAINAHRGKGKTHFGLTMPGPIAVFNLDVGLDGVIQKFMPEKVMPVIPISVPYTQDEAKLEVVKYEKAWEASLKARDVRSILIDTESELWELYRMAEFGQLSGVMPYQYGPLNVKYAKMVRMALTIGMDKNVCFLRHFKPMYVNDKRTADYEPAGFGKLEKIVQVVGETWREDVDDGGSWHVTISKCRLNPDVDGQDYDGEMASFPWLGTFVFEGTGPDDWR